MSGYEYEECNCHPWCFDPSRDEAVRASEDGRSGPLPTLEEAIAAVTDRRPPEPGGGGNVTGLRTERVTLEVTHDSDDRHIKFRDWDEMLFGWKNGFRFPGESVRVVEECCLDRINMGEVIRQRDAAIRERDKLRAERITQALTADRFAAAVIEVDTLKARVAELESGAKLAPAANSGAGSNHAPAASGAAGTGVVLPECPFTPESTHTMGWWEAIGKVKKALAAAGVTVTEVGSE